MDWEEIRVGIVLREIRRGQYKMQYRTGAPEGRCQKWFGAVESFQAASL
jgi:hypothetical protein